MIAISAEVNIDKKTMPTSTLNRKLFIHLTTYTLKFYRIRVPFDSIQYFLNCYIYYIQLLTHFKCHNDNFL